MHIPLHYTGCIKKENPSLSMRVVDVDFGHKIFAQQENSLSGLILR